MLQENGVAKAIEAAEASNNPHLIDDFHRLLVEWVREGLPAKGSDTTPYNVPLRMTLFEVTLPQAGLEKDKAGDQTKALRDFMSLMEQFYRGMLQMDTRHGEYFSFEIANPRRSDTNQRVYRHPRPRAKIWRKNNCSLCIRRRGLSKSDDYNGLSEGSATAAAMAKQAERPIYSLRTFDAFLNDPLDTLLNAFSQTRPNRRGRGDAVCCIAARQRAASPLSPRA